MPTSFECERMLRSASLRVTRPRLAVLATVHDHPHADTNSIIELARTKQAGVSHQAVYDVLEALTTAGLIRRIQPAGSLARYESRVGDNHHHVICRSCGEIADVDCATGVAPCLMASDDHGYAIDEAEVVYWGLCPTCSALPDQPSQAVLPNSAPQAAMPSPPQAAMPSPPPQAAMPSPPPQDL